MAIWNTLRPRSGSSTFWILESSRPSGASASRTWSTSALRSTGVLIRVPDSKSIPNWIPFPAIASAPTSRITPDAEKNHFDFPTKSNFQPSLSRAPMAQRDPMIRVRAIAPRIAEVASTAVNSDTIVPTPSVNAKPFTPAVARVNRMNATPIVTTLASTIVRSALV